MKSWAALLTILVATAVGPIAASAETASYERGSVQWVLVGVGRTQSVLIIGYERWCGTGLEAAGTVREPGENVVIQVTANHILQAGESSGPPKCSPPKLQTLAVKLARPIAGRRVYGRLHKTADFRQGFSTSGFLVPRLVGLSPEDALGVLAVAQLRGKLHTQPSRRARPQVVGQSPLPGKELSRFASVHLVVAR